ncbi:MAG TPA: glycosyltransferase [Flavisolibacter sp.]|nr:glycosyltransferase [Flavisolibacter sp.]
MMWIGYVLYGIYVASTLWLLFGALVQLHLLWHARHPGKINPPTSPVELPFVTIQVPVYNEKFVIENLLHSLTQLNYPKHLFEIQVLDDSTDETVGVIDRQAAQIEQQGCLITVVRRKGRIGYKAGALQNGLACCRGELVAIFDADFIPPADFLRNMVPHFADANVGMVQARWGHLNAEQNFLTRIQTYLLDMHFLVEQEGRQQGGYLINFCGTAGIWRKQCIVEAGGWDGEVLSEDLDLSYRAQLRGWRLKYDKNVVVPAQLPSTIDAFKIQQFRWTKGMAQVAKKTAPGLKAVQMPLIKKVQSGFHLLGSFTFVCLFINAALALPLLQLRHQYPEFIALTNYTSVGAINLLAMAYLYYSSAVQTGDTPSRFIKSYFLFVVVYLAMSVQNAVAVLQGVAGMRSPFVRTPKFTPGLQNKDNEVLKFTWVTFLEVMMLFYFFCGIGLSLFYGDYFLILFFVLMCSGLIIVLSPTIKQTVFVQKPVFVRLKKAFTF